MTTNIYALKLENSKWYIGKSDNPEQRCLSHMNGTGSAWTRMHKPIQIHAIFRDVSAFSEDALTKEYMSIYGIDNVRGGSYDTIDLTKNQKDYIMKKLWSKKNLCNKCGSADHWVENCSAVAAVDAVESVEATPLLAPTSWYANKR